MQPTSIQLSFSQAKADPSIAWARLLLSPTITYGIWEGKLYSSKMRCIFLLLFQMKLARSVQNVSQKLIINLAQAMLGSALAWLRLS